MPTYEWICQNDICMHSAMPFDRNIPMDDRDTANVRCPACGKDNAIRQVVPSKAPLCVITEPGAVYEEHVPKRVLP